MLLRLYKYFKKLMAPLELDALTQPQPQDLRSFP